MRLGLLAPEYNGKSSYLVALYGVLIQDKNEVVDYPVSYRVQDDTKRRTLNDRFGNLVNTDLPKDERFPPKNVGSVIEYVFSITDKKTGVSHDVTIIDYPGGLLRGSSTDSALGEVAKLNSSLSKCDAFIVVLDAEYLIKKDRYQSKSKLSPNDIYNVLTDAIKSKVDKFSKFGIPVAFCVSKLDLLGRLENDHKNNIEIAYHKIKQFFPTLFLKSHLHPVMIAGVSLGPDIAGKPGEEKDGTKLGGPFEPFFIETPFEFCLALCSQSSSKYNEDIEDRWDSERRKDEEKMEKSKEMDFFESVGEWFKAGANIGEWPEDYHKRQKELSERIRDSYMTESRNFHTICSGVSSYINKTNDVNSYAIYYGGDKHKFKTTFWRGNFPLEKL